MTIDQLIERENAKIAAALATRKTHTDVITTLRTLCTTENRDPSDDEATKITEARAAADAIDVQIGAETDPDPTSFRGKVVEYKREKAADEEADKLARETKPAADRPAHDRVARVGAEERTYRPDLDRTGGKFLKDVARSFLYQEPGATQRLNRHMAEELVERGDYLNTDRAAGTGAFAGLTVPQYLTDMAAPLARSARPFADICNHHDLPQDGMTVNLSRITTGTSVALQANESDAASETNIDDTLLTESVQTAAGQQTLSRQAIDRSTGAEDIMLQDLFLAYATSLDSTLITQATTGLSAVVPSGNKVAYTDASPTAAELWPKLLDAQGRIEEGLLHQDGTEVAIMRSRRWAWLQSQVGPNWPFIAQMNRPTQAGGVDDNKVYNSAGYRGNVAGLDVVTDNNIGNTLGAGTEDEIFVVVPRECHLWEDPNAPVLIRAEQTKAATLGVLFVVYGYFAYTFRRYPLAVAKVYDTGLISPVF